MQPESFWDVWLDDITATEENESLKTQKFNLMEASAFMLAGNKSDSPSKWLQYHLDGWWLQHCERNHSTASILSALTLCLLFLLHKIRGADWVASPLTVLVFVKDKIGTFIHRLSLLLVRVAGWAKQREPLMVFTTQQCKYICFETIVLLYAFLLYMHAAFPHFIQCYMGSFGKKRKISWYITSLSLFVKSMLFLLLRECWSSWCWDVK